MTAERCPPGLRDSIMSRDGCRCAKPGCGSGWHLEMHHLVSRGKCGKALRWHPKNLLMLCGKCHGCATLYAPDFRFLNVSGKGDINASLEEFWQRIGRPWEIQEGLF